MKSNDSDTIIFYKIYLSICIIDYVCRLYYISYYKYSFLILFI